MIKKNIEPLRETLNLKLPNYTKEQKVVEKALNVLGQIGDPRFSATDNCWKTNLKPKDESRLWYVRGLLEALLFEAERNSNGD